MGAEQLKQQAIKIIILIFVLTMAFAAMEIKAAELSLQPNFLRDTVYFRSDARLEFIEGKTTNIEGYFEFDPMKPNDSIYGIFRVDLRTLSTGIGKRDEHMRERNLHTDKYPYAYFEFLSVNEMPEKLSPDSSTAVTGEGVFHIHGFSRKLSTSLEFSYDMDGNEIGAVRVRARFTITLDDYEIPRPRVLFLKLAETIEVEIVLTGYNGYPSEPIKLPKWKQSH